MNNNIATLKKFNEWRRGSEIEQPNPTEIGKSLDYAIDKLTGDDWIKCSDELPEEDGNYLVYQGTYKFSREFVKGKWLNGKEDKYGKITHWQNLPNDPIIGG